MANLIAVVGLGAVLAGGAATQLVQSGDTARVPAWLPLPPYVELSNISGTGSAGHFELAFAGASDDDLRALRAGLEGGGFRFAMKSSQSAGISRAVVGGDATTGRRIEIDLTELPDHDVWRVSYVDSGQG